MRGDSIGEEGAGDEESGRTRACALAIRLGIGPYRGVGAVSIGFLSSMRLEEVAAAAAAWWRKWWWWLCGGSSSSREEEDADDEW